MPTNVSTLILLKYHYTIMAIQFSFNSEEGFQIEREDQIRNIPRLFYPSNSDYAKPSDSDVFL